MGVILLSVSLMASIATSMMFLSILLMMMLVMTMLMMLLVYVVSLCGVMNDSRMMVCIVELMPMTMIMTTTMLSSLHVSMTLAMTTRLMMIATAVSCRRCY